MVTVLYSGNFGLGHELETILRAVSTLNGDANLKLLLVGNGKGLTEARRLVDELGLQNSEFRLPVPLHELPNLLAAGDIHVVAQKLRTEGLIVPSKIYGTLAAGRPVVFAGPDHCEVAQIVRAAGCGFVVAPGDVQSAASALRQLAKNEDLRRRMGASAKRYYRENFGRQRSVARIVQVIQTVADDARQNHPLANQARRGPDAEHEPDARRKDRPNPRPVAAALLASVLMLVFGAVYHAVAACLDGRVCTSPIPPNALEALPLQIADWTGQDIPLDEAVIDRTGTDAHINRIYSRRNGSGSVSVYVACGRNLEGVLGHRPEGCYPSHGWTLEELHSMELGTGDERRLPCRLFLFSRGELNREKLTVLHYFVADGQCYGETSLVELRMRRILASVSYVAQVQIVASAEATTGRAGADLVHAFAIDSASFIAEVFKGIGRYPKGALRDSVDKGGAHP